MAFCNISVFWSKSEKFICCFASADDVSNHRYITLAEADGHGQTLIAFSLAPTDNQVSCGMHVLCARMPRQFLESKSLIMQIYDFVENEWHEKEFVLDEFSSLSTEDDSLQRIYLTPYAEQPPSFRLNEVSHDNRLIGTSSEMTVPRHRIAPFTVSHLPLEKIKATLISIHFEERYRVRLDFSTGGDLHKFANSATLCRFSRAGFAGKSAHLCTDEPEKCLSAVRLADLLTIENVEGNESWFAEVHDACTLEIAAWARPGDLLALDIAGVQIEFEMSSDSASILHWEPLGGGLIFTCHGNTLVLVQEDTEDPFLQLVARSIELGDASDTLAALRPPQPKQMVNLEEISAIWNGEIERFLPMVEDLAASAPYLLAIENAWLATPDHIRLKADCPEVLCLAASAPAQSRFHAWLFGEDTPDSLTELVLERFSKSQLENTDCTCHRTVANILARLGSSETALVAATQLGGKLHLIERTSDALIADLARLFDLSIDEQPRAWVDAIKMWDRASPKLFEAFGELVGRTTDSPAQQSDYGELEQKIARLIPLVRDREASGLAPMERDPTRRHLDQNNAESAFQVLEEFVLAVHDADNSITPKVAE